MKKNRLSRIGADNSSRQPAGGLSAPARGGGARPGRCGVIANREQDRRHRKAENAGADEGAAPAPQALHHQQACGRHRRAEHAGEGVNRKRLADAVGRNMVRQQRVVGRVIDRVADAGEREHRHQHPEGIDQARDHECAGADQQSGDQQDARAQPIDQKADRRLQHGGHDVEGGERHPDLGVAHAIFRAHEGQQRRQQQDVIMRDEMRRADRADDARVRRAARAQEFGCLTHNADCLRLAS